MAHLVVNAVAQEWAKAEKDKALKRAAPADIDKMKSTINSITESQEEEGLLYELLDVLEKMNWVASKKRLQLCNMQTWTNRTRRGSIKQLHSRIMTKFPAAGQLNEQEDQTQHLWNSFFPVPDPDRRIPYGREREAEQLIAMLTDSASKCVFVVGEAGMGKTALVQHVYNDRQVTKKFETSRAWVNVSNRFSLQRVLLSILQSVKADVFNKDSLQTLHLKIRQALTSKECLFVLDDVMAEDIEKCRYLTKILTGKGKSKILITTRTLPPSPTPASDRVFTLNPVSDDDCWSIIKDSAFGFGAVSVSESFNQVGKDIAKKCNGVPLAAKSLGSLLSGNTSVEEWQEVLHSIASSESDQPLKSTFMLSYSKLSPVLKQCLLYCSLFPKNQYIQVEKLIKLWMAHTTFVPNQDDMETQALGYLRRLLHPSMFQEFKLDDDDNTLKCKLYGAMSDFLQGLAKDHGFGYRQVFRKDDGNTNTESEEFRHITLDVAFDASLPESDPNAEKLHSLMILSQHSTINAKSLSRLLKRMQGLRALSLSSCSIYQLPLSKASRMLHLRYLDLSFNHDLWELPQVICDLLNLQTLILNGCDSLRKLPKDIGKLINLRHLEILWTTSLSYLPKGVASLTSLRTLNRFFGSSSVSSSACSLEDFKNLNCRFGDPEDLKCRLGDLGNLEFIEGRIIIDGLGGETDDSEAKKAGLKNKTKLRVLELWFSTVKPTTSRSHEQQEVLEALEAPSELQGLGIFYYAGSSLPGWMMGLRNLTCLVLADCSECESLPPLGKLPLLETLEIKRAYGVKKLGSEFLGFDNNEGSIAFAKLKKLCFQKLDKWEQWNDYQGHAAIMPKLSNCSIQSCRKIKALPNFLKREQILKKKDIIHIDDCPLLKEGVGKP